MEAEREMSSEKEMRDVVAHYICSSDPSFHVASLEDVERVMTALGFPHTERLDAADGAWLRFHVNPTTLAALSAAPPRHVGVNVASPCRSAHEYAYDLKLPVHLHVAPNPAVHFRPFLDALRFFTHPIQPFHLKNVEGGSREGFRNKRRRTPEMAQAWRRILFSGVAQLKSETSKAMGIPLSMKTTTRFFTDGARLFVGGISFNTTEDRLRDTFAAHGEVMDAKIIMDRESGRSRGFGFITYYKEEDADTALSKLNGHNLDGRQIRVDRASSRPARPMGGGGGFGAGDGSSSGGGGYGARSSFSGFNDPEPAGDEDWGSLPSLNVDLPDANSNQN